MSTPRPEDLVERPRPPQRGGKEQEGPVQKKIPGKFIAAGAGLAVILLCFMMVPGNKAAPKRVGQVSKPVGQNPLLQQPQAPQQQQQPQAAPAPAETVASIDASLVKTDATIKALAQQILSIDTELHNLANAAERLGQIGDQEGKKDAERQASGWGIKRKEYEAQYNKWVAYRAELVDSKASLTGSK